jgi:hypothetical protein
VSARLRVLSPVRALITVRLVVDTSVESRSRKVRHLRGERYRSVESEMSVKLTSRWASVCNCPSRSHDDAGTCRHTDCWPVHIACRMSAVLVDVCATSETARRKQCKECSEKQGSRHWEHRGPPESDHNHQGMCKHRLHIAHMATTQSRKSSHERHKHFFKAP